MPDSSLVKKLFIKPGYRAVILNAPEGYRELLGELPPGVKLEDKPEGSFDFIQVFVKSAAELEQYTPVAIKAVKPGGALWVSFPKKTSKIKTDINRDAGWDALRAPRCRRRDCGREPVQVRPGRRVEIKCTHCKILNYSVGALSDQ